MKLKLRIAFVLLLCFGMIVVFAFYFSYIETPLQNHNNPETLKQELIKTTIPSLLNKDRRSRLSNKNFTIPSVASVAGIKINNKLQTLNFSANSGKQEYIHILKYVKENLQSDFKMKVSPWSLAAGWVKSREIHSENTPELGYVLNSMVFNKIDHAGIGYKGTQLKMMLKLEGGQEVIFKPQKYNREYVVTGSPYAGADRHNGEIAAFHLNRLLGLCRSPLTVGRIINLKTEVLPVASESLSKTFFTRDNDTCFYGHCYYCSPADPACGTGDVMEGALILMFPEKYRLKKYRSPWQRTYKETVTARWEQDFNYCDQIRKINIYKKGNRLLDLIDAAVFDYLIGNADSIVILLDNGKSFGNPYWDELTILAPLYQCCKIRRKTYERLWTFVGHLGLSLKSILSLDQLSPVLSQSHYESLDRRLKTVLAAIEVCLDDNGEEKVLMDTI
ncbi:glycosaminoglycan xylosylkinase isoform X1 [Parasteatoda tepidariorum]|uniref:glycosaminoglycan xylosylkinase isoform X1 n=1 Tax=Parasteatoda tepidariorum TaxID=114398 RepID=UPI001C72994B|nr:glycosaminoglycan xylosylkinase isoform X2 [Parasteatoda tepidariorum]